MPARQSPAAELRAKRTSEAAEELRRAALWGGVVFAAIAVLGFALAPEVKLVWVVLLLFGIAAGPQAFRRNP